jgi:glutathione peroxidase
VLGPGHAPRWNFHKYLVGRDGKLLAGYGSGVEPLSAKLIEAIEAALAARPAGP